MTLDDRDLRIIRELRHDGRLTNVDLAERVGLSPSNCLRRTRALEESGIIRGFTIILDARRAGLGLSAYLMIDLDQRVETDARSFVDTIARDDRIVECAAITGAHDVIAKALVADVDELGNLTLDTLLKLPSVRAVTSCIRLKDLKTAGWIAQ